MDRRDFLVGGGAVAAASSVGTFIALPGDPAPATAASAAVAKSIQRPTAKVISQPAAANVFQMAFIAHEYRRGSLMRAPEDVALRVIFYGFGAQPNGNPFIDLLFEAAYLAPDASVMRHQLWSHTRRSTSNSVRFTLAATNFVGLFASYERASFADNARGQDLYHLGGSQPIEYGSYVLAGASRATGQLPNWDEFTYSGNPAQPLKSSGRPIDFDYVTFEVTRLAA